MRSYSRTFGANRWLAAAFFVLGSAMAISVFVPGVLDYLTHANFSGRRMRVFNSWEPEHRMLLAYAFAGLGAFVAVTYLRLLIDNTLVVVDRDGITVRHALWKHRGLWRDFDGIKTTSLFGAKDVRILFRPGQDERGRKLSRKVRLPNPILGVKAKAVLMEVLELTTAENSSAPASPSTRRPRRPLPGDVRPGFGKRQ